MNKVKLNSLVFEKELDENGYIVFRSFLNNDSISELLNYYNKIGLNSEKTQPNYLYANPELSKEITEKITSILNKSINKMFIDANFLGGVFMVKKTGENKEVDFHQDWNLVDESKHTSYNLWCPLLNSDKNSGSLMIMNKSEQAGLQYRSATFPPLEIKIEEKYERFISSFELNAGDAILYKHSMFHGSGNNMGKEDRIAIACGIIPADADFIYHHWNKDKSVVETYKIDNNFYLDHIFDVLNGNIPTKYKIISETPFSQKPLIDETSFYKKMRKLHGLKRFLFFD